jgi:hypothetical protein
MAALISSGRWFDKDAYKECCQILKKPKTVGAIILVDEEAVMKHLTDRFMRVFEEQGHSALINRTLFDGFQILMGNSVEASSKASAPPPVPTAPLNLEEGVRQRSRIELLSLHLERIISKAAAEGDQTLTKRTCRDELMQAALGLSTLDPTDLDFIKKDIPRIVGITSLCMEYMEKDIMQMPTARLRRRRPRRTETPALVISACVIG